MREIKFRGKRVNNGEWVYGFLFMTNSLSSTVAIHAVSYHIQVMKPYDAEWICYEVSPETVGQFTGLNDKNGKGIYDGDVIGFDNTDIGGRKSTAEVIFCEDPCMPYRGWALWVMSPTVGYSPCDFLGDIEVIGNIHDNGDLT